MPIEMRRIEDQGEVVWGPVVVCDWCGQPITFYGNVEWLLSLEDQSVVKGPAFTHKQNPNGMYCSNAWSGPATRDEGRWGFGDLPPGTICQWEELDRWLEQLSTNLDLRYKRLEDE